MRILLTTGIFRPEFGGPATFAAELAARLQAAGNRVTVVTYSNKKTFDFDREYPFALIRVTRSNKFLNYLRYFLVVLKEARQHDLIYSLDWFSAGMPVRAVAFLTKKKYVVRVGGGYIWEKYLMEGKPPVTLKEFYEKKLYKQYRFMYVIIKNILQHAATVVFNSDEQRIVYEKCYKLDQRKTLTIYNATPEHKFGLLLKSYKNITELSQRDKEIVFFGRFIKMKNVESLIQAFAKLQDFSYKLLLIGEGPTEPELRALVEKLDINHRVIFMPPMTQKELYRRIANCAYVVIPSWTDVSPHQAYECLAQGIPFLLTKENYLSINQYDFLKINPASIEDIAEKMNSLLDEKTYNDFVSKLSRISFHHSWNEVMQEHMQLFRKVLSV